MANELIINASLPETRIALMEDGEIQELLIERASGKGIVGNIYKGRVTRVLPGMQAAFVDIGLEKAAFLYVDDVYVHSEIWEDEEENSSESNVLAEVQTSSESKSNEDPPSSEEAHSAEEIQAHSDEVHVSEVQISETLESENEEPEGSESPENEEERIHHQSDRIADDDDSGQPAEMGSDPEDGESKKDSEVLEGTIAPEVRVAVKSRKSRSEAKEAREAQAAAAAQVTQEAQPQERQEVQQVLIATEAHEPQEALETADSSGEESAGLSESGEGEDAGGEGANRDAQGNGKRRHRRGRRGGRFRRRPATPEAQTTAQAQPVYPENYHEQVADTGNLDSDRSGLAEEQPSVEVAVQEAEANRPEGIVPREQPAERRLPAITPVDRSEFRAQRSRDRRIRQKTTTRVSKSQVNIQDLLKEGQEVLVQVAKDPIATKGARLTCHISLPGRHLVCMPTIDHVGVSRRIEREDERRRLREYVERNRPKNLGFIVRTASGRQQSEKRIKQDIEYLTRLWGEIKEKAANTTAPALVYEDLNAVLRAIRDWVTEEIDKVIVDSRYHYNEIQRFVSHFMPPLKQKVELYHGDIPIFDAYGISTELSRALERKVWLKSGGYIVIDQAEALVAIDVNTGRYVGKKNLEDTILKTNLEAVQEIAYQLRLRNCGGIIILDFIDMEKDENKQRVYRALEDALARDRARPSILKISELGLVEMTRKRTRDTIVRTLCESCTHCEGKGFIKSKQTVAYEVMREIEREGIERDVNKILVQAHPDVIDILAIDERETLDQLERRYRKLIYLQAVTDFHPEQFEVTADKRERADRGRDRDRDREHHTPSERSRHRERHRHEHHHPTPQPISAAASNSTEVVAIQPVITPVTPVTPVEHGNTPAQAEGNSVIEPGNMAAPSVTPISPVSPISSPLPSSGSEDGFFDEEDRLAFLRAQAAQDAALARLGNNHSTRTPNNENPGRMGNNNRRGNRGRRGAGKFRRGNDRGRERGPKQFGYNNQNPKWNDMNHDSAVHSTESSSSNTDHSGGNTNTGGSSGGGGGDHSQPPI